MTARQSLPGVITPARVGVMTPEPADDTYRDMAERRRTLIRDAGTMLARSLRDAEHGDVSRKIAEELAAEANDLGGQMADWRLSHGYSS